MLTFGPTSLKAIAKKDVAKQSNAQSAQMQEARAKQSAIHNAVNSKGSTTFYKNKVGRLTKKTSKLVSDVYPDDFPVPNLAGEEMPPGDAGRAWEVMNLQGDVRVFSVKGENNTYYTVYYFLPLTFVAENTRALEENPFEEQVPEIDLENAPISQPKHVNPRPKPAKAPLSGRLDYT